MLNRRGLLGGLAGLLGAGAAAKAASSLSEVVPEAEDEGEVKSAEVAAEAPIEEPSLEALMEETVFEAEARQGAGGSCCVEGHFWGLVTMSSVSEGCVWMCFRCLRYTPSRLYGKAPTPASKSYEGFPGWAAEGEKDTKGQVHDTKGQIEDIPPEAASHPTSVVEVWDRPVLSTHNDHVAVAPQLRALTTRQLRLVLARERNRRVFERIAQGHEC